MLKFLAFSHSLCRFRKKSVSPLKFEHLLKFDFLNWIPLANCKQTKINKFCLLNINNFQGRETEFAFPLGGETLLEMNRFPLG